MTRPKRAPAPAMSPAQYDSAMAALELLTQGRQAAFLGVSLRTAHGYANGSSPIPEVTAKLLRLMVRLKLAPEEVR